MNYLSPIFLRSYLDELFITNFNQYFYFVSARRIVYDQDSFLFKTKESWWIIYDQFLYRFSLMNNLWPVFVTCSTMTYLWPILPILLF